MADSTTMEAATQQLASQQRTLQRSAAALRTFPGMESAASYLESRAEALPGTPVGGEVTVVQGTPTDTSNYVQLANGDWVLKSDYGALSEDDQKLLMQLGVQGFNDYQKQQIANFTANHVQVGEVWIAKSEWDAMTPEQQKQLQQMGVEGYTTYLDNLYKQLTSGDLYRQETAKWWDARTADLPKTAAVITDWGNNPARYDPNTHVWVIPNQLYINKEQYNAMTAQEKALVAQPGGIEQYNQQKQQEFANLWQAAYTEFRDGKVLVDKYGWVELPNGIVVSPEEYAALQQIPDLDTFLKDAVRLPSGEWVSAAELNALPEDIATLTQIQQQEWLLSPEGQAYREGMMILRDRGLPAYNQWVGEMQKAAEAATVLQPYVNEATATSSNWVQLAINGGVDYETFAAAGVDMSESAYEALKVLGGKDYYNYTTGDYDLERAVRESKVTIAQLVEVGFFKDKKEAEQYVAYTYAIKRMGDMDLHEALAANKLNYNDLVTLGICKTVDEAKEYNTTVMKLERTYKEGQEYRIGEAVASGNITAKQAQLIGFDPVEVKKSVEQFKEYETKTTEAQRLDKVMQGIDDPKYKTVNPDDPTDVRYDLVAIMRDKKMSPGDMVTLFAQDEEGKKSLQESIRIWQKQGEAEIHKKYSGTKLAAQNIARTYLDWTVPVYGTIRHWDTMSPTWKGLAIAADVMSVIPLFGAIGRGARAVTLAKPGLAAARVSRVRGALKAGFGLGIEMSKPSNMSKAAWEALNPAVKFRRYAHLYTGELWKQVAWGPGLLEIAGTTTKRTAQWGKQAIMKAEVRGRLLGDVFDPKTGNIIKTPDFGTHPVLGGKIERRIRAIITDDKGRVLLVSDRAEPAGFYGLPGGGIDVSTKGGLVSGRKGISLEDALRHELEPELGVRIRSMEVLPTYGGRFNPHSPAGGYVYRVKLESNAIDTMKHAKGGYPELKDWMWWDGKTPIAGAPSTQELLRGYAAKYDHGWDTTNFKIHSDTPDELRGITATDHTWANRLQRMAIKGTSSPLDVVADLTTHTFFGAARAGKPVGGALLGRVKAMFGPLESVVVPWKLPESVISDARRTIKIAVKEFETVDGALQARAKLMRALEKQGNSLVFTTPDAIIVMRRGRLMREVGGGMVHATPRGEGFITGTVVQWKNGMPLNEQGLFWSPEPLIAYAERSAFGMAGKKPTLYIASPEWIQKNAKAMDKLYHAKIEAEVVSPVSTVIPPPSSASWLKGTGRLYTRLGHTGQKVEILLQKPLTKKQVLKLKLLGLVEQVQNIYSPIVYLDPALDAASGERLAGFLDDIGEAGVARNVRAASVDPEGTARVIADMDMPEIHRVRVTNSDGVPRFNVERVEPRSDEDSQTFHRRVLREQELDNERYIARLNELAKTEVGRATLREAGIPEGRAADLVARVPTERAEVIRDDLRPEVPRTPAPIARVGWLEIDRPIIPRPTEPVPRIPSPTVRPSMPRPTPPSGKVPGRDTPDLRPPRTKKEEREKRKFPPGALTWNQGKLRHKGRLKDVWITIWPPYTDKEKVYTFDKPPVNENVKQIDGPGSAYKSLQQIGAKRFPAEIKTYVGFMRVNIPKGERLEFDPTKQGRRYPKGAIAWKQGSLKRDGKLQDQWIVIWPPYTDKQKSYVYGRPEGDNVQTVSGVGSAYKSLVQIGSPNFPSEIRTRMGLMKVSIRKGAKLSFKRKPKKSTASKAGTIWDW